MRNSPNYQEMYVTLFRAVTKAIELLQAAQIDCEELLLPQKIPLKKRIRKHSKLVSAPSLAIHPCSAV